MQRDHLNRLTIGAAAALLSLAAALSVFGQNAVRDSAPPVGTVSALFGEPNLKVETTASPPNVRYVKTGGQVFERDVLETGPDQTATVLLQDDSEIVLAPSTRCLVETFVKSKSGDGFGFRSVLNLMGGTIRALVRHVYTGDQFFAVKTGNSTMGVRGTHFVVAFDQNSMKTDLHVLKGTVAIGPSVFGLRVVSDPVATAVHAGTSTLVAGNGGPSQPSPFNSARYHQQLKSFSPDFERAVGSDAAGANRGSNGSKTLSDALKAHHEANTNRDELPGNGPGANLANPGPSRNLRDGGPSFGGPPGGGPNAGPGTGPGPGEMPDAGPVGSNPNNGTPNGGNPNGGNPGSGLNGPGAGPGGSAGGMGGAGTPGRPANGPVPNTPPAGGPRH